MTAWSETRNEEAIRRWDNVSAIQTLIEESALLAYEAGVDAETFLGIIADTIRPMMEGGENL